MSDRKSSAQSFLDPNLGLTIQTSVHILEPFPTKRTKETLILTLDITKDNTN